MKDYFNPEGRRVAWLLCEVERQTKDRLSGESQQSLLDEVACHLDAAIQARLELGMVPLEAELEAVESFGAPNSYVDDLLRVHEMAQTPPRYRWNSIHADRKTMIAFWIISLYVLVWMILASRALSMPAIFGGLGVMTPVFAYLSFKARRIQPVPILLATLTACVLLAIVSSFTWDNLWAHGGMGYIHRWEAESYKSRDRRAVVQLDWMMEPLESRAKLHSKYSQIWSNPAPNTDEMREMMEIPVLHSIPFRPGDLSNLFGWLPASDSKVTFEVSSFVYLDGGRAWKDEGEPLLDALQGRRRDLANEVNAIKNAQATSPLYNLPMSLVQSLCVAPIWFGFWALINLLFGGLGWFFSLPPAIRRRRTA